jgi:hypothetical protein
MCTSGISCFLLPASISPLPSCLFLYNLSYQFKVKNRMKISRRREPEAYY